MNFKFDNVYKVGLINFFLHTVFLSAGFNDLLSAPRVEFFEINSLWGIITATIFLAEIPTGVIADKSAGKNQ